MAILLHLRHSMQVSGKVCFDGDLCSSTYSNMIASTRGTSSSGAVSTMSPKSANSSSSGSGQSSRTMLTTSTGRNSSLRPHTPRSATHPYSPGQSFLLPPPAEHGPSPGLGLSVTQPIREGTIDMVYDFDQSTDDIASVDRSMSELTVGSPLKSSMSPCSL